VAAASEPAASATPAASSAALGDAITPPLVFALLFLASSVGTVREIAIVGAEAYLVRGHPFVVLLVALAAGALFARRRAWGPRELPWLAFALSLLVASFAPVAFFTFGRGGPIGWIVYGFASSVGLVTGAAAVSLARFLGKTLLALGAFAHLANPFRLLAFALACGLAAGVSSVVGMLRTGSALGLFFATLGFWCASLHAFLEARKLRHHRAIRWAGAILFALELPTFALHERLLPNGELGLHTNPVVYRAVGTAQRFTVTAGQDAFELWVDGHLAVSTIDETRYSEALVQPVMAVAPRKRRVLILGNGFGLVEREVLRHPDVEAVTLVVLDRRAVELGQRLLWLRGRSKDALFSPKLRIVEAEATVWLEDSSDVFDVAIVDLPDPHGYVEGKTYTSWFQSALARHLEPDGVVVTQATSAFATPRTFDNIEDTMAAAGFFTLAYHAPIPTMGDWGFVLGSRKVRPDPAGFERARPFLSGVTPSELSSVARDTRPLDSSLKSTLSDQHAVELFAEERGD
jgi:spermidine synthase